MLSKIWRWCIALVVLLFAVPAFGVVGSKEEAALLRAWTETHLLAANPEPGFSFTCGGRSFAKVGRAWPDVRESRSLGGNRTEHTLTWTDPVTRLEVRCVVTEFADLPAVEWVLYLRNAGPARTPIIDDIRPLDAEIIPAGSPCTMHYSMGDSNSAKSFAPKERPLKPDEKEPFVLAPRGGRSSDPYLPFFNLAGPDGGVAIAVGWSGQWEARFERSANGGLRVRAGQQLTHLSLLPGETIRTPRMLLVFWQGSQPLRGSNLMRRVMIDHYLPRRDGQVVYSPICASVNWTAPDGTYEGPHLEVIPALAQRGIEVFWSDMDPQQWYPGDFPKGTGNWEVDPKKYPRGLKPIGDAVKAASMEYLLWFEPERVYEGTRIDREHPEWVMKLKNNPTRLFRFHDTAARKWLTDCIDQHVTAAQLGWVRWDFNMEPLAYWRQNDGPDRQGITEIEHVEGLYAMWDNLRARHPGLVIDNCASGGRRIDLETCTRGLPLWHSDMQCSGKPDPSADQLQNAGLFRWVPMHGTAAFDYEPSYAFRSAMTAGNILAHFNAKGHVDTADPDTQQTIERTVATYKKLRPYMLGDFYPLFAHVKNEDAWFGYQFHRADQQSGMAIVFRRTKCTEATMPIKLYDIDPASKYEITYEDTPDKVVVDGVRLSSWPVRISEAPGTTILYYRQTPR